jgi:hypothetical protein
MRFKVWDCRRRTCITTVTTGSRGVYGMAIVGNELVTSVGNSLCAWDLRQLSAGAVSVCSCSSRCSNCLSLARVRSISRPIGLLTRECRYRRCNKQRPRC